MSNIHVVIKYRDIFTNSEQPDSISALLSVIKDQGSVWCPWINHVDEYCPERVKELKDDFNFYFLNSETKDLCEFILATEENQPKSSAFYFAPSAENDITFPDKGPTLESYKGITCQLWIKVKNIKKIENPRNWVKKMAYCDFNAFKTTDNYDFGSYYDGKKVQGRVVLLKQPRSIFFLRNSKKGDKYPDNELFKVDEKKYATTYTKLKSNRILMLSDIHCPYDERRIIGELPYRDTITKKIEGFTGAALIVAGDFSSKNDQNGFKEAEKILFKIRRENDIPKSGILFVPGNHDIALSNDTSEIELTYSTDDSKKQYQDFYNRFLDCDAKRSLCRGIKLITQNGLTIDILGLNSIPYQQNKSGLKGFGIITQDHIDHAAGKMGWKEPIDKGYTCRIIVFHHPLFPVGNREENPSADYKQQTCINSSEILGFINQYDIDLVITGHAHEEQQLTFKKRNGNMCTWIGLGALGATDVSEQFMSYLDFSKKGYVSLYSSSYGTKTGRSKWGDWMQLAEIQLHNK